MRHVLLAIILILTLLPAACSDDDKSSTQPEDTVDFTPASDISLSGEHTYNSIAIPAGVTVSATDDLVLRARGSVTINGILTATGHAITIHADSSVTITGAVRNVGSGAEDTLGIEIHGQGDMTFDGAEIVSGGDIWLQNDSTLTEGDFPDSSGNLREGDEAGRRPAAELPIWVIRQARFGYNQPARAGADKPVKGGDGRRGKDIVLYVRGHLQVLDDVRIVAQDGGRGGKGTDQGTIDAEAEGGRGGRGGDVRIFATGEIAFTGGNRVQSGSGGDGGGAEATGFERDGGGVAASAEARGWHGGNSGLIDIRCRESISLFGPLTLQLGNGGDGGEGIARGAEGKPAGIVAAQTGGRAEATGGRGGNSPEKRLRAANVGGLENLNVTGGRGGQGGNAIATAGNGKSGNETFTKGGDGGDVIATGGRGGDSRVRDRGNNLFAAGGNGGDATIDGGNAGTGWHDCIDPCEPVRGGQGGQAGDGTVEGGEGGSGQPVGDGGDLTILVVGNGGNGGDGNPAGDLGEKGNRIVRNHGGVLNDPGLSFADGRNGALCTPALGACCGEERTCVVLTCTECRLAGGVWQGAGTVCDPNPCPRPAAGACCYEDGTCSIGTESECHGGAYQGDGTDCDPNPCPQPATGACCAPNGDCQVSASGACDGTYQGDATDCDPNPCPQTATGACCAPSGGCQVTASGACDGVYQGDGTICEPDPCPPPTGACCTLNGGCVILPEAHCAEVAGAQFWLGSGTGCAPFPCDGLVRGACCPASGGGCRLLTGQECNDQFGDYVYRPGVPCHNVDCGEFEKGACCAEGGGCSILTRGDCTSIGSSFQGTGTTCDPDPCLPPDPTAACCLGFGICTTSTRSNCQGEWLGPATSCAPSNPCSDSPAGDYLVTVAPLNDPHGHDPFTQWSTIIGISFSQDGTALGSFGPAPYVGSSGAINPDGSFVLIGSGTVAGRSGVDVRFEGRFRDERAAMQLDGTIKLGNDVPPFQLPNGSVTYTVWGWRR